MTGTAESPRCKCGMNMMRSVGGALFCANCDQVQPQEPHRIKRRKTPNDIRFDMAWLMIIKEEYKDNTTTEVGSANSATEEESSDVPEGETHEEE